MYISTDVIGINGHWTAVEVLQEAIKVLEEEGFDKGPIRKHVTGMVWETDDEGCQFLTIVYDRSIMEVSDLLILT